MCSTLGKELNASYNPQKLSNPNVQLLVGVIRWHLLSFGCYTRTPRKKIVRLHRSSRFNFSIFFVFVFIISGFHPSFSQSCIWHIMLHHLWNFLSILSILPILLFVHEGDGKEWKNSKDATYAILYNS